MDSMMAQMIEQMVQMDKMAQMTQKMAHMEKMSQMTQKMAQMEEREAQMAQRMAQIDERLEKMEEKMSLSIQINERLAQIVDVQGINIQSLSSTLNRFLNKAEQIVLEQANMKSEEPANMKSEEPIEKCRICSKVEVNGNEVVCDDCWKHCEPAKQPGLEAIEIEITNLRTENEDRYWRFHDKFVEKLEEYSQDTLHLFTSNDTEIKKLTEKHNKTVEDVRFCINRYNNLKSNIGNTDERINRIMDVVNYLTERTAGKDVAVAKFNFMKFNFVEHTKGSRMTLDELV